MIDDPHLQIVAGWVGKTYEEMEQLFPRQRTGAPSQWVAGARGCWNLVRAAYQLRGVVIPEEYHAALDQRLFRTVFEPQPFDVVPISLHRLPIVTHVGLFLGEGFMVHAIEESGVIGHPLSREPWWSRIAKAEDGRRGYLRLRT